MRIVSIGGGPAGPYVGPLMTRRHPQHIPRPRLADPAWTLHEEARGGITAVNWPKQYLSAKAQYETNLARAAAAAVQ